MTRRLNCHHRQAAFAGQGSEEERSREGAEAMC